jgi:hypothetical protein
MLGDKLADGLRVYADMDAHRRALDGYCGDFADVRLVALGYPDKVADSIIDRLARKGWIEYGVSARSGWLTDEGIAVLGGIA